MRLKSVWLAVLALILAACGGDTSPDGLRGTVSLTHPLPTSVIYASVIYVAGSAQGVPDEGLNVALIAPDGEILTQARVNPADDGAFSVELVHGYTGDALMVEVLITLPDAAPDEEGNIPRYATSSVLLASLAHRPEGLFADILTPESGAQVGGDQIGVSGRASGLPMREFTVELVGDDGAVIDTQTVTLSSPYPIDDVPWGADLNLNGYTGNAVIVVRFSDEWIERLPVEVASAAG